MNHDIHGSVIMLLQYRRKGRFWPFKTTKAGKPRKGTFVAFFRNLAIDSYHFPLWFASLYGFLNSHMLTCSRRLLYRWIISIGISLIFVAIWLWDKNMKQLCSQMWRRLRNIKIIWPVQYPHKMVQNNCVWD